VVAQRKASVASKATGRLEWLAMAEGSKVREGEVIARLENRDMQAQVDQAAASVTSAGVELQDARRAMNWQSFSELAFSFTLNTAIVAKSLAFALLMGLIGGFLSATRAARMNIVDTLRAF
jgi:multidrug efflux pump subunit AcrA (membrane-fusion protein)